MVSYTRSPPKGQGWMAQFCPIVTSFLPTSSLSQWKIAQIYHQGKHPQPAIPDPKSSRGSAVSSSVGGRVAARKREHKDLQIPGQGSQERDLSILGLDCLTAEPELPVVSPMASPICPTEQPILPSFPDHFEERAQRVEHPHQTEDLVWCRNIHPGLLASFVL